MRYSPVAHKSFYTYERHRLFLDAASIYLNAIMVLKNQLSTASLKSVGLMELQEFLTEFTNSSAFLLLTGDTKDLLAELDEVTYCIHVKDLRIEVRPTIGGKPYSKEVEDTFKTF